MSLERIRLKGFQVHKDLTLNLSPTITTIIGPSDAGKSAILRALRWLVTNRPAGDAFINDEGTQCSVRLKVDGKTITRKKGKKLNEYHLAGSTLKAFGSQVPDDVGRLLNLSEINFQDQHDSPFWFSKTAAEVSRQLNQIVNLDLIDTTLANLAAGHRKAQAEVHVIEDRLSAARVRKANLSAAKEIDEELKKVEKQEADLQTLAVQTEGLARLVEDAKTHTVRKARLLAISEKAQAILNLGSVWQQLKAQCDQLEALLSEGQDYRNKAKTKIPDIGPLQEAYDWWMDSTAEADSLEHLITQAKRLEEEKCQQDKALSRANASLSKELRRLRVCPLCGQKTSWPLSSRMST